MTLSEAQRLFCKLSAQLITWTYEQGYELTWGESYRTPEQAALNAKSGAGISNSLHIKRLAVDLLLWKDGVYLTDSDAYKPLGEYWEGLNPNCAWGGRFTHADGNHFSFSWQGVK